MHNQDLSNWFCPLCQGKDFDDFYRDRYRDYFRCWRCQLVIVPPVQFLSLEEEKARYDLHQNSSDDPAYRQFLNRLFLPINENLAESSCGLDFGSGPGPTLSVMFEEAGHSVRLFDLFYAPDISVFNQQYDFVTISEVAEHLHDPQKELNRLWGCLKQGGCLGIMTKLVIDQKAFAAWHYKDDPTHVSFFSKTTFEWLARKWQADLTFVHQDVMIFKKNFYET